MNQKYKIIVILLFFCGHGSFLLAADQSAVLKAMIRAGQNLHPKAEKILQRDYFKDIAPIALKLASGNIRKSITNGHISEKLMKDE